VSLTIDSSTPAASQSANGVSVTSLASNTFSPPAGSVIVVFWGNGNTGTNPTSITDSLGSHLSWSSDTTAGSTSTASAGMYWASCPSAQSNMTVTVNFASTQALYILPVVFTGEVSTSLGATTTASPASGSTLTATVTPQAAGSYVFGVFCNGFSTASPSRAVRRSRSTARARFCPRRPTVRASGFSIRRRRLRARQSRSTTRPPRAAAE